MVRRVSSVAVALAAAAGVVAGVGAAGRGCRPGRPITFSEIEVRPPAGLSRREFLEEVQYLAGRPDRLVPLAESPAGLASAFARHPRVRRVVRVTVTRGRVAVTVNTSESGRS